MGILSKVIKVTAVGAATTTGTFLFVTRKSTFSPVSPTTDAIFQSSLYNKFNPNHNPTMHDLCVRKVPISKIKPSLRREDGKLAEAFCAGVWSGVGTLPSQLRIWAHSYDHQDTRTNVNIYSKSTMALRPNTSYGPHLILKHPTIPLERRSLTILRFWSIRLPASLYGVETLP